MKPSVDVHKDGKASTPRPSRDKVANGESDEKVDSNNSDKLNSINKPATSEVDSKSNAKNKTTNNKDTKTVRTGEHLTRGRKTTSLVKLKPCDCKLCGETFDSDKTLGYHIRDVHVVGKKEQKDEDGNRKKKPKDYHYVRGKDWKVLNPKRPYCCSICSKRFLYESSLNHHKAVKHNEKVDTGADGDNDGDKNSSTANSTNSGNIPPKMYNHTFQCDQCGKILMSKHSLIRHLVSFHGTDHEKPFQCDICGQRYVSISSLVSHRRKEHTGDKPYVCEHCGKAFTMSNRLKCHLRVHSDEKFYKCQQCSKQFKSCSAFRAHKDTHLGVMRHTCKYCERKFLFQGNMVKHIRRRHPNGEKTVPTGGGESGLNDANNNSIDINRNHNNNNNIVFSPESNNNIPIVTVGSTTVNSGPSLTADHILHSSTGETIASTMTDNSIPITITPSNNNISRRTNHNNHHRYPKPVQTPDHSYFTKEVILNVNHHAHLLEPQQQQQQNTQSLSPMEQFQPEIQFQVLPFSSISNQELFNGINTYQSTNSEVDTPTQGHSGGHNQTQTINNSNHPRESRLDFSSSAGKCRLCDTTFPDIRFHIIDFHRIPVPKVESMIPTMVYF